MKLTKSYNLNGITNFMLELIESEVMHVVALICHVHQVHHGIKQLHNYCVFLCAELLICYLTLY